jgi:hypothetical protein
MTICRIDISQIPFFEASLKRNLEKLKRMKGVTNNAAEP